MLCQHSITPDERQQKNKQKGCPKAKIKTYLLVTHFGDQKFLAGG